MERCSEIMRVMQQMEIHSCPELMALIQQVGFLPLLDSGVRGYSAEDLVDDDCRYVVFPDGGWDWPLWKWKGPIVTEGNCVYGKFFAGKAGFVSRAWWPDLCNYRRSQHPIPQEGSIEDAILFTLNEQGSMITRELRAACGFNGPKMRSRFDAYITRLQMACRIVTVSSYTSGIIRAYAGSLEETAPRSLRKANRETHQVTSSLSYLINQNPSLSHSGRT